MSEPRLKFASAMTLVTQDPSTTYVFVEGPNKKKLLDRHVASRSIKIRAPPDDNADDEMRKEAVVLLIKQLNEKQRKNALGIVDADFDHILGSESIDNIVRTEHHDLLIDMLMTGVLKEVVRIMGSPRKLDDIYGVRSDTAHESIFTKALEIAAKYGVAKLVCCKSYPESGDSSGRWPRLPCLNLYCRWRKNVFRDDYPRFLTDLARDHGYIDFPTAIASETANSHSQLQLARGHDVTYLIVQLMDPISLVRYKTSRRDEVIEDMMIATMDSERFSSLHIYKEILQWKASRGRDGSGADKS